MVNIAALNYLPQTVQWEAQIPRLEDGWWPTGGAVDPATDSGLMNWQAQLLGNRTAFLKSVIDGAGIGLSAGVLVGNLDTITLTGTYRAAAGVTGAPVAGTAFTVEHRAGATTAEATQEAWALGSDRAWSRRRVGSAWLPWREQVAVTDALFGAVLSGSGYQRLPSGLIMQWGGGSAPANGSVTVTLPIAFPNAVLNAIVSAGTSPAQNASYGFDALSTSQIRLYNSHPTLAQGLYYQTIGH
jgi:hypothetical protein